MMPRKIAVSLSKGGVGKTTTAINLAAGLALSGRKVLLVDADTQGQCARSLGVAPEFNLVDLIEGGERPSEIIFAARENLDLIAGGPNIAGLKRLIGQEQIRPEGVVGRILSQIDEQYHYVILDTSPGWDVITMNVLFYAMEIICPVSQEVLSLDSLKTYISQVSAVQEYHDVQLKYILPTILDGRVRKSAEIFEQLQQSFPVELCQPIRYNVRLSEAPGWGQTIYEHDPRSPGAEDYANLVQRVVLDE